MKGYINTTHVMGRTLMSRHNSSYMLQYQWRQDSNPLHIRVITKKEYDDIKKLAGPEESRIVTATNDLTIMHTTSSKYYMRIKRYVNKL